MGHQHGVGFDAMAAMQESDVAGGACRFFSKLFAAKCCIFPRDDSLELRAVSSLSVDFRLPSFCLFLLR